VALDNEYESFMAELGDDGQRRTESGAKESKAPSTAEGISGGVKIEKKGHQTVIQVTNVMTGLPPVTPMVPSVATPAYPGMSWMGTPAQSISPVVNANPWGYYYPTAQYATPASDGNVPTDPTLGAAAAAASYGYPSADYSQQQAGAVGYPMVADYSQQQAAAYGYPAADYNQQPAVAGGVEGQQQYDYAQYQQYYAQWYAAQATAQVPPPPPPPAPPTEDAEMGV
jgi:hypothetical protein